MHPLTIMWIIEKNIYFYVFTIEYIAYFYKSGRIADEKETIADDNNRVINLDNDLSSIRVNWSGKIAFFPHMVETFQKII